MSKTKAKVITKKFNDIQILGENLLYNNGNIVAYYILPTLNYTVVNNESVLKHIEELFNLLTILGTKKKDIKFTIERFEKVVRATDVKKNLLEGIKIYSPEYELPKDFSVNIKDDVQQYTILGIHIDSKDFDDVEEYTIGETLKTVSKNIINKLSGLFEGQLDIERILKIEEDIFATLSVKCLRASPELVFYNYVSKLFPNYEISYDKLSYINENNFSKILGVLNQTLSDNFGYFVMHNEGVDIFDLPQQETYGCILEVKGLPLVIDGSSFPINYQGTQLNIKLVKKEEAIMKIKRARADDLYEAEQGSKNQAEFEDTGDALDSAELLTQAIQDVKGGDTMCLFHYNILVTGQTLDDVKKTVKRVVAECKDRDILVTKSLTQAETYINNYVNLKPLDYNFFSTLRIPLSCQLNSGSVVGDVGTDVYSYAIGEDLG